MSSDDELETLVRREINALLRAAPPWLDGTADTIDAEPTRLQPQLQRGRNRLAKHAWCWETCIHGPLGSAYEGCSYRVLVRIPLGYPEMPPRLQLLSIFSHLEVETRDPYEGHMDESFYERLRERRASSPDMVWETHPYRA